MKHTYKLLQVSFFSLLSLTMVHCGSSGDGGTNGSSFIGGETDSGLSVPTLAASKVSNDVTLTVELDAEATFSYIEIERKDSANGEFAYLDEVEALSFEDQDLNNGTYTYRVRAVHAINGMIYFSSYSDEDSVTIGVTQAEVDKETSTIGE